MSFRVGVSGWAKVGALGTGKTRQGNPTRNPVGNTRWIWCGVAGWGFVVLTLLIGTYPCLYARMHSKSAGEGAS